LFLKPVGVYQTIVDYRVDNAVGVIT